MSAGSGLLSTQKGQKAHLLRGGGIAAEVADLRTDLENEFEATAAIAVEEFTNLAAADDDGIKTSIASSASIQTYTGTALNGVVGVGALSPPRNITITTSSHANINAVAVVVTGKDVKGNALTENITLTDNGGVTDAGNKTFASVSSIVVPAQGGTSATLKFGFGTKVGFAKKLKVRAGVSALVRELLGSAVVQQPSDIAVSEWLNAVAPSANGLEAATAVTVSPRTVLTAGLVAGGVAALLAFPRNVTFTTAGSTPSDAPATATITGTDIYGAALVETVNVPQTATIAEGVKAFKTITSVAYSAADGTDATVAIGFGKKLGLTSPVKFRAGTLRPLQEIAEGAVVTSGTFADATTSPPNGTYSPSADPDGAKDYAAYYESLSSAGSTITSPVTALPHGSYTPSLAADGSRDYTVYYEYDASA